MSHRNDLNELTGRSAERLSWGDAVTDLHEALQIVGIVLDDLAARVRAIEEAAGELEPPS